MGKKFRQLNFLAKEDLGWVLRMREKKIFRPGLFWGALFSGLILLSGFFWRQIPALLQPGRATVLNLEEKKTAPPEQVLAFKKAPASPKTSQNLVFPKIDGIKNILLAGVPGQGNSAPFLTDTLILASLSPDGQIKLFSFPRDFFISPQGLNYYTKINNVFNLFRAPGKENEAAEKLANEISRISGLTIDDYLIVDLNILKETVDLVGGIEVETEKAIYDACYPGPNYSCLEYSLEPGRHLLDGEGTLKYARSRHSVFGDFDRIKRQQEVLLALKEKVQSQALFENLNTFVQTWQNFWEKSQTSLSPLDFWKIWQTIKNSEESEIVRFTISNQPDSDLLRSGHFQFGDGSVGYVLTPKAGLENYEEIQKFFAEETKSTASTSSHNIPKPDIN